MPYCSCFSFSVGLIPDFMGNYSLSSMVPSKTFTAGPVIDIWPVASSHSMVSVPPSITTLTVRPVRPVRCAATAVAQAPVPQACVMPDPLPKPASGLYSLPLSGQTLHLYGRGTENIFPASVPSPKD